jgi:hypothetical protein
MSGHDVPPGFVRLPLTGAIVPLKHSPGTTLTGAVAPSWRRKAKSRIGIEEKAARRQPWKSANLIGIGDKRDLSESRHSKQGRDSLLSSLVKLEANTPERAPFRSPHEVVGQSLNDLLAYADVLIAHVRFTKILTSTERDYLGKVATVFERVSTSKADKLRNALAFTDVASRITKAAPDQPRLKRVSVPRLASASTAQAKDEIQAIRRAPEPIVAYSELARSSLIKHITQLEACRPNADPFRAPHEAVGRSVNDLLVYADVLIAHVRSAAALSASERNYLGLIARLLERQSGPKAEELRKALAIADLTLSRSAETLARSTAQPVPSIPVKTLSWEVLPQGKWDFNTVRAHYRTLSTRCANLEWDLSRLRTAESLRPKECWVGQDEFEGYAVYVFPGGKLALLDHPLKGNACYILRGDWRALSRLSKYELLTEHDRRVTRVVHRGDWKKRLRGIFSAKRALR